MCACLLTCLQVVVVLLFKVNEVSRLQGHRVGVQLGGGQAGGDGSTQQVHRGARAQAQQLRVAPWGTEHSRETSTHLQPQEMEDNSQWLSQ